MFTDDRPMQPPPGYYPPDGTYPPADTAPPKASKWRWRWRIVAALLALFLAAIAYLAITAPLSKSLEPIAAPSITLLSADGDPIARKGAITDDPVVVSALPKHVPGAFLAIEDRRFYNHLGIDPWGIGRALVSNTFQGTRQGGSTITQQLAKVAFLSSEQTMGRKVQEAMIALWLEAWLTKDEILSRYLSTVYFGDNVYGLRAAANHYFSRDPDELTVGQSAMLAGLLRAPSRLAPTRNIAGARERAEVVLATMVETQAITQAQADDVGTIRLDVREVETLPTGTYFADWAFPQARAVAERGYGAQTVTTTLDDDLQRLAVRAVRNAGLGKAQIALVAMRPTGEVVAMIGGKSYKDSPFNRATQARRQPGSTFKLFVYLAAMRAGMDPDSRISDRPLTLGDWSPRNNGGTYRGDISLRQAFAMSSNVAAVRLQEEVGRDRVIQTARDLGVVSPLSDSPSLALGTSNMRLIELVSAYAAVASGNYPVRPRGLPEAEAEGWFAAMRARMRRFSEASTWPKMLDLLHAAANDGTGRAAALRLDTFGKTGTTQDNRDAIFVGFAGDLVAGVWVGNDDNSPLPGGIAGGGMPARVWRDFMAAALNTSSVRAAPERPTPEPVREPEPAVEIEAPLGDLGVDIQMDSDGFSIGLNPEEGPIPVEIDPPSDAPLRPEDEPVVDGPEGQ